MRKALTLTLALALHSLHSFSQPWLIESDTASEKRNYRIIGLPAIFYTPETSFGFGGTGVCTFFQKSDSLQTRPSNVQLVMIYTLKHQAAVSVPFQLFLKNNTYNIYGDAGYYQYNYNYWGIGPNRPDSAKENYTVRFPRVRFNALRQTVPFLYAGVRYGLDHLVFTEKDDYKELGKDTTTGSRGGTVSNMGLVLKFDNRDNTFYATKGWFVETYVQTDDSWTGSDFRFRKYSFDACTYLTTKFGHTLALNAYTAFETGDVPFNQLLMLGGARRLRGYYEGRYRDKAMALVQAEYRFPVWWRFGAVVFGGYGGVAPELSGLKTEELKYNYGMGLRFLLDEKRRINARIDYGRVKGDGNFYFTLGEAF